MTWERYKESTKKDFMMLSASRQIKEATLFVIQGLTLTTIANVEI